MIFKTNKVKKTSAVFFVLMSAAKYVHSAITITFAQSGADVTMTMFDIFETTV